MKCATVAILEIGVLHLWMANGHEAFHSPHAPDLRYVFYN